MEGIGSTQAVWSCKNIVAYIIQADSPSKKRKATDDEGSANALATSTQRLYVFGPLASGDSLDIAAFEGTSIELDISQHNGSEIVLLRWSKSGDSLAVVDRTGRIAIWTNKNFVNRWSCSEIVDISEKILAFEWLHSSQRFRCGPASPPSQSLSEVVDLTEDGASVLSSSNGISGNAAARKAPEYMPQKQPAEGPVVDEGQQAFCVVTETGQLRLFYTKDSAPREELSMTLPPFERPSEDDVLGQTLGEIKHFVDSAAIQLVPDGGIKVAVFSSSLNTRLVFTLLIMASIASSTIECTQASTVALSRLAPDMMADSDYFLRLANASLLLQIGWVTSTRLFTLHNLGENPESADEFSHKSTCFIWEESSKEWTMEACHFSMSLAQSARLFRSVVHTEDGEPEDTVVSLTYENGITEFRSGRSLVQNYVARPFSMPLAGPSSADLAPDMKNAKAIALSPNGLLGIALLDNQDDILGGTFFSLFETKLGLDSEPLLERLCKSTVVGLLNGYDCYDNILVLVQLQQEILRDQELAFKFLSRLYTNLEQSQIAVTKNKGSLVETILAAVGSPGELHRRILSFQMRVYRSIPRCQTLFSNIHTIISLSAMTFGMSSAMPEPQPVSDAIQSILDDKIFESNKCDTVLYSLVNKHVYTGSSMYWVAALVSWILEYCAYLARQLYLLLNLKRKSKNLAGLNSDILERSNPLVILFHPGSRRLLQEAVLYCKYFRIQLACVVRKEQAKLSSAGKGAKPSQNAMGFLRKLDQMFMRTRLMLEPFAEFLFKVDRILRPIETQLQEQHGHDQWKQCCAEMLIKGSVPAMYFSSIATIKQLFEAKSPGLAFVWTNSGAQHASPNLTEQHPSNPMFVGSDASRLYIGRIIEPFDRVQSTRKRARGDRDNAASVKPDEPTPSAIQVVKQHHDIITRHPILTPKCVRQCTGCFHYSGGVADLGTVASPTVIKFKAENTTKGIRKPFFVEIRPSTAEAGADRTKQAVLMPPWDHHYASMCICGSDWKRVH